MTTDAGHHVGDAESGDGLNETVDPESEEGQALVDRSEIGRDKPFDDIIDDREEGELVRPFVESLVDYCSLKSSERLFTQYLNPVGRGPSGKTCPRWPLQFRHTISILPIP